MLFLQAYTTYGYSFPCPQNRLQILCTAGHQQAEIQARVECKYSFHLPQVSPALWHPGLGAPATCASLCSWQPCRVQAPLHPWAPVWLLQQDHLPPGDPFSSQASLRLHRFFLAFKKCSVLDHTDSWSWVKLSGRQIQRWRWSAGGGC